MVYMNTFGRIFTELLKKEGLTDAEIARRLNVNRSTIGRWKTGEQSPQLSKLKEIAMIFGVNPMIFVGEELKINTTTPNNAIQIANASVPTPYYGSIAAGVPIEMIPVEEYIDVPSAVSDCYEDPFLLRVNGDSMNKVVPDGSYALIAPCEEISNGDVVAVAINGDESTLKRFYKLQNTTVLEPDSYNSEHKAKTYSMENEGESIRVIGKLVWFMSPFHVKY